MIERISARSGLAALSLFLFSGAPAGAQMPSMVGDQIGRQVTTATSNQAAARIIKPSLKVKGQVGVVALAASANGKFAAAGFANGMITIWDVEKGREVMRLRSKLKAVAALAIPNNGDFVLAGGRDGALYQLSLDKDELIGRFPGISALAVDGAGQNAAVGTMQGQVKLVALATKEAAQVAAFPTAAVGLAFFNATPRQLVAVSVDGTVFSLGIAPTPPKRLAALPGPINSAAFGPLNKVVLAVGSDGTTRRLDTSSGRVVPLQGMEASPLALALVGDGNAALVGTRAGEIIIADAQRGGRLARLATTDAGWAVIDYSGRFDGNSRGVDAVSWQAEAVTVDLGAFAKRYFEPGMLSNILFGRMAELAPVPGAVPEGVALPPAMVVTLPKDLPKVAGKPYQLVVLAENMGGGIDDIRLFHNGKLVDHGSLLQTQDFTEGKRQLRALAFNIIPTAGLNTFRATALSSWGVQGVSERMAADFGGTARPGGLNMLVVGVNKYGGRVPSLELAVSDASAVASAVGTLKGSFSKVSGKTLLDENASKASILATLKQMAVNSQPEDTLFLFFAGHGVSIDAENWSFLPFGVDASNMTALKRTSITASEIEALLVQAKAKRIVLAIDACQSGAAFGAFAKQRNFYLRLLGDISRTTGLIVYAATQEGSDALEINQLGHGVFTYSLLSGLKGEAAVSKTKAVTAFSLADYLEANVPALTQTYKQNRQDTATFRLGVDFPLASR